jgi:hypothetical protein
MSLITRTFLVPVLAWTCMSFPAQATAATTDERLNKYLEVTSQHAKGEWQTNLGPTGAMGWIYLNRFYIESVEAGSPADGLLKKGDYILGVNGNTFPVVDPRVMLGKEINKAEAADGTLVFQVGHHGVERKVTVKIKPIGGRSPTWPFDCKKSAIRRCVGCAIGSRRMGLSAVQFILRSMDYSCCLRLRPKIKMRLVVVLMDSSIKTPAKAEG